MTEEQLLNQDNGETLETPQELIDRTIAKVEKILEDKFPNHLKFESGSYTISRGSVQVMTIVRPYTHNETCIEFIANLVTGATVDTELTNFLLRKNVELHFGSFGLLFDNTIVFSHSIAGTNLDDNEFVTTLNSIAVISDYYDDEIIRMAGGKRANGAVSVDL